MKKYLFLSLILNSTICFAEEQKIEDESINNIFGIFATELASAKLDACITKSIDDTGKVTETELACYYEARNEIAKILSKCKTLELKNDPFCQKFTEYDFNFHTKN